MSNAQKLSQVVAGGTAGTPQFAALNIGHATDTTLTRVSAGKLAQEGVTLADLGANNFTGGQNEARGSVAMHATTMDLWAQPNIIDGTSTAATVTAIANAPQAGARRVFYPVAASVITNGATFAVDGAANHTAAAGDKWEFEAITTSTYKVHVTKKDGTAVVNPVATATVAGLVPTPPNNTTTFLRGDATFAAAGGGSMVYLSTVTASSSATADIETTFDATYDVYLLIGSGITTSEDASISCRMKIGGTYLTTSTYKRHNNNSTSAAATYAGSSHETDNNFALVNGLQESASGNSSSFRMNIYNPSSTTLQKAVDFYGLTLNSSGSLLVCSGVASNSGTSALTGVRIYCGAGTFSGTFRLYGIKNS